MVDTKSAKAQGPSIMQSGCNLAASAEAGGRAAAGEAKPALPPAQSQGAASQARAAFAGARGDRPCTTCKLPLKIAIFFDGTGNNMDADVGTGEHSNVARLFRSHTESRPPQGIYRLYVPGLGTYFKDIGDPGDEDGLAFAARGEDRLQWAMNEVDQIIGSHSVQNIAALQFALFGFSRGSAAARAFARRLQERCSNAASFQRGWMNWRRKKMRLERYVLLIGVLPWLSACAPEAASLPVASASRIASPVVEAEPAQHQSYLLTIAGYNYTDRYIDGFDVNGQGGGNLFVSSPTDGGGKGVCCVSWWTGTKLPKKVRVSWVGSYCRQTLYNKEGDSQTLTQPIWRTAEAQISGPIPQKPHYFEAHIYGDGHVDVAITERTSKPRLVLPVDAAGNRPGIVFDDPPCPKGYDRSRARDQLR